MTTLQNPERNKWILLAAAVGLFALPLFGSTFSAPIVGHAASRRP